jgi:transcriptional regulator with XRE-family HTH domain
MALFFDPDWFNAKLSASHLSRSDLARALGVSESDIADIWKDQRELSARDVALLAALLNATPQEIAQHAGISTPVPPAGPSLGEMEARLAQVERELAQIKSLLSARKKSEP